MQAMELNSRWVNQVVGTSYEAMISVIQGRQRQKKQSLSSIRSAVYSEQGAVSFADDIFCSARGSVFDWAAQVRMVTLGF